MNNPAGMTPEFVRRGELLVPTGVTSAEHATQTAALRAELVAVRELAVAQQAEHRAVVATLVEQATTPRVLDPADDVDDVAGAARLREELAAARDLVAVKAEDAWARRAQATEHQIAMADVDERAAAAKRDRQERARDAAEAEALAALYRRATRSGARARIRAEISGSAEMRALRVAAVRKVALAAGLPVLLAFAAWSTTGVQAGVVRLLDLADASPAWWASWAVEPALITIVALIIVGRAVLRSSGGDTDWRASLAEWSALGLSLALNIVGGAVAAAGFWSGLGGALPHAIGPLGCAGTAFLIGLFDGYVSTARPWDGVPRLADLDLGAPVPVTTAVAVPPLRPVTTGTGPAGAGHGGPGTARALRTGTGTGPAAGPVRPGGTASGRSRPAVAAPRPVRRTVSARTDTGGTGAGTAKTKARMFWETEVAAGRVPTGTQLARAAGKTNDESGIFRRYAREWAGELGASTGDGTADTG